MMGGSYQMYEEDISGFLGGTGNTEETNSLENLNVDGKIIFI